MNLTPEQREVGKQNFNEAVGSTRRDFLKGAVASGAVASGALGAMYFGYGGSVENPVRVGIIGTGDEGGVLIGALNPEYVDVVAIADIRPYSIHRAFHGDQANLAARPGLMERYDWKTEDAARKHVKVYTDQYEELLEDSDVEAVIIALPLWLHHPAAIQAMRKGKHVLTEKLMAKTVAQCKEMGRVADAEGKLLATGHQRHYSILYANAVDQIRRGLLGNLHHIRAQWHRGNMPGSDSWRPPMPEEKDYSLRDFEVALKEVRKSGDKTAERALLEAHPLYAKLRSWNGRLKKAEKEGKISDAEIWSKRVAQLQKQLDDIVLAEKVEKYGYQGKTLSSGYHYSPLEELIRWRLWERTGAGLMAELGSHQLDAASIFVSSQRDDGEKVYPLRVQGMSTRSIFPENREVDDHVHCNFEFPAKGYYEDFESGDVADPEKKIVVSYSSINGNGFGGYGEVVLGTKGTLILEKEKEVLLYKGSDANSKIEVKESDGTAVMNAYETGGGAAVAVEATPKDVSRGYREEIEHWAWCIRNPSPENQPKCKPKVALADAVIALTSNIAMNESRVVEFEKEWFDIESDATPDGSKPRKASEV